MTSRADEFLQISPRIRVLPIIHGSGDFAICVREELLSRPYDCLAVPLPPSFQEEVESAIERLPIIAAVVQRDGFSEEFADEPGFSYVPIDPCQGVIAALRTALGERIRRVFIDRETSFFEPHTANFPDPYALKRVKPASFAATILPAIPLPTPGQHTERIHWMARRLRELERHHQHILLVCSLLDWPWIRDAYIRDQPAGEEQDETAAPQSHVVDRRTLMFLLGELPFVTALYERGRRELTPDDNLSIDGVKELVLATRDRLQKQLPRLAQRLTPQLLGIYFRYVRNLSLMERRLTPDLYSLVIAAKQTAGDDFALALAETAREYTYQPGEDEDFLRMGIDQGEVPVWGVGPMVSRLPGQTLTWRSCELKRQPRETEKRRWLQRWDPFGQCSWPPEDQRIESFQRHVRDQAKALIGADLARSEKFTTSVMDGLDMRETLRHWHTGDIYVKVVPPSRGSIEVVVFLFDVPADPRLYTHRVTWFAEHNEESTLAFYSTDPMKNLVGPGIAQAEYGGAFFIFPPRHIPDVWQDERFDFTDTLEERLLAGALFHSQERHVALVSPKPPPASWRRLAKHYGRKLVHLPLKRFSGQLLERLRRVHVLNGKHVRSYGADFIRDL